MVNRTTAGPHNDGTQKQWSACGIASGNGETKRFHTFRSVHFQAWMYFFLLAALALFVLWAFQALFFKSAYRTMKRQEVERLGEKIVKAYPGCANNADYDNFLRETALLNGLNIVVFRVRETYESCPAEEVAFAAEYISSQFNAGEFPDKGLISMTDPHIIGNWETFFDKVRSDPHISYMEKTRHGNYFIYGAQIDAAGGYLYVASPYLPIESTISVMTDQLLIATVVCLVLSVVVSYFISNRITKPITEFSRVAKKLGAGDYTVRFKGNGYTEIENLAETLNYATVEIGKTEQMRRDFLANVSHDLRTPLTMVKAYAEMIRDISGTDEVKRNQHSQVIIDEADRLTGLVNDILNLSKLQSGTETLELGEVDLRALVKTVIERFDVYATRDGYVFDFSADGACTAVGDSKRLEQVMYNLVGNAVSHTGDSKTVRITVTGTDENVRVSVRDFGSGIAPEELDKVWERYYRAGQNKRNVVGSGLGLSIVKSILSLHDATYGVSSNLGEGTEFWFELQPARPAAPLPAPEKKPREKKKKSES